jgi:hypothetical protein
MYDRSTSAIGTSARPPSDHPERASLTTEWLPSDHSVTTARLGATVEESLLGGSSISSIGADKSGLEVRRCLQVCRLFPLRRAEMWPLSDHSMTTGWALQG